jgi:hypothetical protein
MTRIENTWNNCNMRDMKKARLWLANFNIDVYFQCISLVAGEGFEPPTSGL